MAEYDVIVAGAGHNGLIVAAYLAKAGVNVCVVEKKDYVGGGVITREVTGPGFKQDLASVGHMFIQANPLLKDDELKLKAKYGLKYIFPENETAVVFPDDRAMIFYRDVDKTCASIEQFSRKDAEAYHKFYDSTVGALDMLTVGMFSPPPPFGAFMSMMDESEEGRELLRTLFLSGLDVCNDWFESDELKIAATRFVSEGMVDPQVKGSGFNLLIFIPMLHKYGMAVAEGGSGALSWALERCIKDLGGTIRTSSPVKSIKVEGGTAKGVVLDSGEQIMAKKAVVCNLHIKQVFPDMVGAENIPSDFVNKVKRVSFASYQALCQALALNEAPKYKAGGEVDQSFFVEFAPSTLEEYLREFDDYKYGIPVTKGSLSICPTIYDPTRAPAGKHTLYLYHYEPYELKEGAARWSEIKQEVADGILKTVQDHATNMGKENVLGRWACSPLDFERFNSTWIHGDFLEMGHFLHQNMGNRPIPRWNYRTPVENLYMCGACTHPGGGVMGGGRAAVQAVMADLGIDFEKVIS